MSAKLNTLLEKNVKYSARHGPKPMLQLSDIIKQGKATGRRGTAIVSCADPRFTPETFLDLDFPEAPVIRNAGGRTQDALRTLLALDSFANLGLIIVIHHYDCGMSIYDEKGFGDVVHERHPDIPVEEMGLGKDGVWGVVKEPAETVKKDVEYLRGFESFKDTLIVGLVLDIETGLLERVI